MSEKDFTVKQKELLKLAYEWQGPRSPGGGAAAKLGSSGSSSPAKALTPRQQPWGGLHASGSLTTFDLSGGDFSEESGGGGRYPLNESAEQRRNMAAESVADDEAQEFFHSTVQLVETSEAASDEDALSGGGGGGGGGRGGGGADSGAAARGLPESLKVQKVIKAVPVTDASSFRRVGLGLTSEPHKEEVGVAKKVWEALQLRQKHVYRKPAYYMGACATTPHYHHYVNNVVAFDEGGPPLYPTVNIPCAYFPEHASHTECKQCSGIPRAAGGSAGTPMSPLPKPESPPGGALPGTSSSGASSEELLRMAAVAFKSRPADSNPEHHCKLQDEKAPMCMDCRKLFPLCERCATPGVHELCLDCVAGFPRCEECAKLGKHKLCYDCSKVFLELRPAGCEEDPREDPSKPRVFRFTGFTTGCKVLEPVVKMVGGVFYVPALVSPPEGPIQALGGHPSWDDFCEAYATVNSLVFDPDCKTLLYARLQCLEQRFKLHASLNYAKEKDDMKLVAHRDFYNCRKVDTHIHHAAAMTQKMLLRFMKDKAEMERDLPEEQRPKVFTKVAGKAGPVQQSLSAVLDDLNYMIDDISLNILDMSADRDTMYRFDRFNNKYNPAESAALRTIFLKTDSLQKGQCFAEITQKLHSRLREEKHQYAENRISVYGHRMDEWKELAEWAVDKVGYTSHIRWMIQTPRLFLTFKDKNKGKEPPVSFATLLDNYFRPLFEVTLDPSKNLTLHTFLAWVSGIDLVDDESKAEDTVNPQKTANPPEKWTEREDPPYAYWCYYFATNLAVLNKLRAERNLTQFSFRPHCGEAGSVGHLVSAFLTAEHINHGIKLRESPPLEYLFYLSQIGLAMSPVSNKCVSDRFCFCC